MPMKRCEVCGAGFTQGRGRPSARCPSCRPGGGKYGGAHKKLAAQTKPSAWGQPCTRCGQVLIYGQEIHLDHLDGGGPADYRGWAHASCNESAGASKGNRMRAGVNGRPRPAGSTRAAAPVPEIRHSPGCKCGGTVTYPGPGPFWTSKCW